MAKGEGQQRVISIRANSLEFVMVGLNWAAASAGRVAGVGQTWQLEPLTRQPPAANLPPFQTNGKGEWDSPGRFTDNPFVNYCIAAPGSYKLRSGRLERLPSA
jgi:hypothetical protein